MISEALEADLSAWGCVSGVLAQTARQIAGEIDSGASGKDLVELSRELRQLVKALKEGAPPAPSAVDAFLASIQAEGFDGRT